MAQAGAGVIAHLILGEDAALDLVVYGSQGFQGAEQLFQGVVGKFRVLVAAVGLDSGGGGHQGAGGQKFGDAQGASNVQTL